MTKPKKKPDPQAQFDKAFAVWIAYNHKVDVAKRCDDLVKRWEHHLEAQNLVNKIIQANKQASAKTHRRIIAAGKSWLEAQGPKPAVIDLIKHLREIGCDYRVDAETGKAVKYSDNGLRTIIRQVIANTHQVGRPKQM